jgi:hypothetical protein
MANVKDVDWDAIEKEYSKGIETNYAIGKEHGISEGAIRLRAKKFGWAKDLNEKIKLVAESKLRAKIYAQSTQAKFEERSEIETAADRQVETLEKETEVLKKLVGICDGHIIALQTYGEDLEKKARVTKLVVDTCEKLMNLCRRNVGINDNANGEADNPKPTHLDDQARAARLAGLLSVALQRQQ